MPSWQASFESQQPAAQFVALHLVLAGVPHCINPSGAVTISARNHHDEGFLKGAPSLTNEGRK